MTHLNMRVHFLENEVSKKQTIIKESERMHATMLGKIQQLEQQLTQLDRQTLEREVEALRQQIQSSQIPEQHTQD